MYAISKYSKINYQPFILSKKEIQLLEKLEDASMDDDDKSMMKLVKNIEMTPEVYDIMIDHYLFNDQSLKLSHYVNSFYEKFPENINAKLNYILNADYDFSDPENQKIVESILSKEIDSLLKDKPYNTVLEDKYYFQLLIFLFNYFKKSKQQKCAEEIFRIALGTYDNGIKTDLSFQITNTDEFFSSLDHENLALFQWAEKNLAFLSQYPQSSFPNYTIFYQLLNKPLYKINESEISEIKKLEDKNKIEEDLHWLMRHGFERITFGVQHDYIDFITHALYVAAFHEIENFSAVFYEIFTDIPIDIFEFMYGDFTLDILNDAMEKFCSLTLDGVQAYLLNKNNYWFTKSLVFEVLCSIINQKSKTAAEAYSILQNLWPYYLDNADKDDLFWLITTIQSNNIEGFESEIEKAMALNLFKENIDDYLTTIDDESNGFSLENQYKIVMNKIALPNQEYHADIKSIAERIVNDEKRKMELAEEFDFDFDDDFPYFEDDIEIPETFVRNFKKVGRNDSCPCGSGKKYKKCCLNMN